MSHQRLTIGKQELGRYLKKKILPELNQEWQVNSNDTILRRSGLIIQGLYFDRSSHAKQFVPWYFIQVLSIPRDHLVLNLGLRLKDKRKGDLWLNWDAEDSALVKTILDAYEKQAKPPLNKELTLKNASGYIEKCHVKPIHFYSEWSLGILYGLQHDFDNAHRRFNQAIDILSVKIAEWEKKEKNPPEWMVENIASIKEFISKLNTYEEFQKFCGEQAERTIVALKIGQ